MIGDWRQDTPLRTQQQSQNVQIDAQHQLLIYKCPRGSGLRYPRVGSTA